MELLYWLYLACGLFYFSLLLLALFGGLVFGTLILVGVASNRFAKWTILIALLPLFIGLFGTAEAYIKLDRWSAQLPEPIKEEEREEWIRVSWVTTYFGASCTVPLMVLAAMVVYRKKTPPLSVMESESTERPTVDTPAPPSSAPARQRSSLRLEECPNCRTNVVRKADGRCPACQSPMN